MTKEDITKIFIDGKFSYLPMRNYPTNKIFYNQINEICSIDLADMIDYNISNNKGFRYIFVIFDIFFLNILGVYP